MRATPHCDDGEHPSQNTTIIGHETRQVKTAKMLELEAKYDKPIDQLIIEAYNKFGFTGACEFLGVTPPTLRSWMKDFSIVHFQGVAREEDLEKLGLSVGPRQDI